jgi:hypothetical protein
MFSNDGHDLWVLGPRRGTEDAPYNLLVFSGKGATPKFVPLRFPMADKSLGNSSVGINSGAGMLNTPFGLVIFNIGGASFWFVPGDEVTAALAAGPATAREAGSTVAPNR